MKIVVNPKYRHMEDTVQQILDGNYEPDAVYGDWRNVIEKVTVADGMPVVVKRFKKPVLFNRIMYTFFRKSKARRSYEYSDRLLEKGIEVAEPIAYADIKKNFLIHSGYYISTYIPYASMMDDFDGSDEAAQAEILKDFVRFTVDMHNKGAYHKDYGRGNIFFYKKDGKYNFALIDVNRMGFKVPSKRQASKCLIVLYFPIPVLAGIVEEYACARGWNPFTFCGTTLYKKGFNVRRKLKHMIKRLIGKGPKK